MILTLSTPQILTVPRARVQFGPFLASQQPATSTPAFGFNSQHPSYSPRAVRSESATEGREARLCGQMVPACKLLATTYLSLVLLSKSPLRPITFLCASIVSHAFPPRWAQRRSTYEPPIDRIAKSMLESTSLIAISTQSFFVTVISSVIISQNTALLYLSQFLAKHSESTPSPKFRMERASAMLQFIATIALLTNQPFLSRFGLSVLCIAAMPKLVHTVRLFVSHWQALVTPPGKIRKGLRKYHRKKAIARENNINELVSIDPGTRSIVSNKKLKGLLSRGDTYNTSEFSDAHRSFKSLQNYIFIDLVHYITSTLPKTNSNHAHGAKVFYLDGSDAATTQAFRTAGFSDESMFVANLFPETSNLLKNQHGLLNVVTADAQTALRTPPFSKIPFLGYYFDGCGGQSGPVISMVEAIFNPHRPKVYEKIAIGFTLTRADPSGRSLFDREQDVLRSVFRAAKENGYNMVHVGDDPNRFLRHGREGRKLHEDTLSTWIMLEKNTR